MDSVDSSGRQGSTADCECHRGPADLKIITIVIGENARVTVDHQGVGHLEAMGALDIAASIVAEEFDWVEEEED